MACFPFNIFVFVYVWITRGKKWNWKTSYRRSKLETQIRKKIEPTNFDMRTIKKRRLPPPQLPSFSCGQTKISKKSSSLSPLSLSNSLSIFLFISIYLSFYHYIYLSLHVSLSLSNYLSTYLLIHISPYLSQFNYSLKLFNHYISF